jgi:hypothetical protein
LESDEVARLLSLLDGTGSDREWRAVVQLRETLGSRFPSFLRETYAKSRKAGTRASCVYHSTRYARVSDDAIALGMAAARDRSKVVRSRAILLLAYSLRKDLLPFLQTLLEDAPHSSDVAAAIDAIENQNEHYFVDRDHSGKVTLTIM